MTAAAILSDTRDQIFALLPDDLRSRLKSLIDEDRCDKGRTQVFRLRIYGTPSCGFWTPRGCFYEIGFGSYAADRGESWNVGGVGFFCYPKQKESGSGKYERDLCEILKKVRIERPEEFSLKAPGEFREGKELSFFFLQRRFNGSIFPTFPVDRAAQDAVWLIKATYPLLAAMLERHTASGMC